MVFISAERGVSKLSTPGHIYFIEARLCRAIKIGWATDPKKRLANLQSVCPDQLELLFSEPGNGREEADLHAKFARHRMRGEWFKAHPDIWDEINRRRLRNEPKQYVAAAPPLEPLDFR